MKRARSWQVRAWLEVTLALAVFHRRLGDPIVRAGLPALGDPGRGDLGDHLFERLRARADGARAGHVTDGPVANGLSERLLTVDQLDELRVRVQHPVAREHVALVRV